MQFLADCWLFAGFFKPKFTADDLVIAPSLIIESKDVFINLVMEIFLSPIGLRVIVDDEGPRSISVGLTNRSQIVCCCSSNRLSLIRTNFSYKACAFLISWRWLSLFLFIDEFPFLRWFFWRTTSFIFTAHGLHYRKTNEEAAQRKLPHYDDTAQ